MWELSIQNPDNGTYTLSLVDSVTSATPAVYKTETIRSDASASTLRTVLNKFYSKVHKADVSVSTLYYDADANEVPDASTAVQWRHVITVNKAIYGFSSISIMAQPAADTNKGTAASASAFTVKLPSAVQASSAPFNGTFVITCTDKFNKQYESTPMKFDTWNGGIEKNLQSIPFLVDKVEIQSDNRYAYRQNGISFYAIFRGLDYDPPLCQISPGGDWPLTGNDDMRANSTVMRAYGESIFYPAIPLEMLKTDAQAPQVLVTVDGMEALCLNLNCDFAYIESPAEISATTVDEFNVDEIIITGTSLPNDDTDVIWFGPTRCTETSNDGTTITCSLDDTRVSGNWLVDILTVHGLTPTTVTTNINVPVSVSNISPSVDVNYLGGTIMTIDGDNFGYDPSVISVTYADGTSCDILSVSMIQITCVNRRFTSAAAATQDVTIEINGESATPVSV